MDNNKRMFLNLKNKKVAEVSHQNKQQPKTYREELMDKNSK